MEKSWDYIIVGAGVLGTATANYLKGRDTDKKILLVDKYPTAGQGNTGKSNACYRNIFDTDLNVMICTASIEYYRQMEKEGIDLGIEEFGYLWLLSDEQYNARNAKNIKFGEKMISLIEFMEENKIKIEMFEKERILEMLPHLKGSSDVDMEYGFGEDIKYGFMGRECGGMAPDLLVKHYETEFRKKGGECSYDTEVIDLLIKEKGMEYDPDYINTVWRDAELAGIRVKKGDGEVSLMTEKIILTTGAWINQLLDPLGINSTVKAKKRQLFRICDLSDFVQNPSFSKIKSIPFLILPTGGVFIKPVPGASCVEVGCSDDIGRSFENAHPNILDNPLGEMEFYMTNILPVLETYFPAVFSEKNRIEKPSAGMYAYSPDKFPIISRDKKLGNLYFSSGSSGSGIMKADAMARILTSLVVGEKECELFGGFKVEVDRFSLDNRNVPKETLVL